VLVARGKPGREQVPAQAVVAAARVLVHQDGRAADAAQLLLALDEVGRSLVLRGLHLQEAPQALLLEEQRREGEGGRHAPDRRSGVPSRI